MISEQIVNQLNELPLTDVMRNNGYAIDHQTARCVFYRCPFHHETDGSFSVEKYPNKGNDYAGSHCYGCKEGNAFGAITLQTKLLERAGEEFDFPAVVKRLAKDFNLIIDGDYMNGFFHRMKRVGGQPEISFKEKSGAFTNAELRAIGCQSVPLFRRDRKEDGEQVETAIRDEQGEALYKYSFGADLYTAAGRAGNFDSRVLAEQFNLTSLDSYTTPQRTGKDGKAESFHVLATDSYPVFLFRYQDEQGWWARKYEPYFRETLDKDGRKNPNHKFTWWYEGDRRRDDLRNHLYGNADVMRAIQTGEVVSSDPKGHPTKEVRVKIGEKKKDVQKFERIIICSGPRDAINTYFHSNAHVVFPHSENAPISTAMINKLFQIALNVYVMYDIDKTGLKNMNELALKHVDLKVIYLPEDLITQQNTRTRKACKDAEEFFNFYPAVMRKNERLSKISVNHYFNDMVITSKRMRFWDEQIKDKKDKDDFEFTVSKFTINFDSMAQFLSANGFFKYLDESRTTKFVHVRNNIVDVVDESQALSVAKEIMKDFLTYNSNYYSEELSNAISTQKRVGRDTMSNIKEIKLNFVSWGKDFDYFFFRNCAVRVTKDGIDPVDYVNLPFHVNRASILDHDFRPEHAPLFEVVENPEYRIELQHHEQRMADKSITEDELNKENAHFIAYKRLYRFKVRFPQAMDTMPPCVQYLYDTCRLYWKKEAIGLPLTAEERQRQDMHFVSKLGAIGYVLSRYRTGMMQQMAVFTDYSVVDEGKSCGGTGKSLIYDFLSLVRNVHLILGRSLKKKENMAKNFQEFRDTVHSLCFIDDLRADIAGDEFYNVTENITVKTLYNNEMTIPKERTPKIFVTTNKMSFDLSEDSTARRIFLGMMSGYYHPANYSGTIPLLTPGIKFGKDIIKDATEDEKNQSIYMMLQCCQFYLGLQESLIPPMEKDGLMRIMFSSIKDAVFIEWANEFFMNKWHFLRPIALKEMVASFLEHKGEEVTTISVKKNTGDVIDKMKLYCENLQYTINPSIVFRAEKNPTYPRYYAWVTPYVNDRPTKEPRFKEHTRCFFFYRMGEEPKTLKEILQCPDTDLEKEEEKEREERD